MQACRRPEFFRRCAGDAKKLQLVRHLLKRHIGCFFRNCVNSLICAVRDGYLRSMRFGVAVEVGVLSGANVFRNLSHPA